MKKICKNDGFSLVELIIVIAIMAVLIGIMAPQFIKYVERSRIQKAVTNTKTVADAIEVVLTETAAFDTDAYAALMELASPNNPIDLSTSQGDFLKSALDSNVSGTVFFHRNGDTITFTYTMQDGKLAVDYNMIDPNHDYVYESANYHVYYTN